MGNVFGVNAEDVPEGPPIPTIVNQTIAVNQESPPTIVNQTTNLTTVNQEGPPIPTIVNQTIAVNQESPPTIINQATNQTTINQANAVHIGDQYNYNVCEKDNVSDCKQKENEENFLALLQQSECDLIQLFPWDTEHKDLDGVYVHPIILEGDKVASLNDIISSLKDKKRNLRPRILIYGDPGIGKSTLAKKLMWDWVSDKDYIKSYKFVIHVELTQASFDLKNLNDIIIRQLSSKFEADEGSVSLFLKNNYKTTLFLLDGPEDINDKCQVEIFEKFFKKYPLAAVILFSRHITKSIWTTKKWFCNTFEVTGFDESCAKRFNKNFFQFKSDESKNTFDLTRLDVCDSLSRIPLFCYFRCNYFHQKKEVLCTITQIYDAVFQMFCHHYLKNVKLGNIEEDDIIPENVTDALKCVGELIFRCLLKENYHITTARLEKHCGKENAEIIRGLGIFREEQRKKGGQTIHDILPKHPTFLDYLVAFYISHLEKPDEQIDHILERLPLLHSKSYRSLGSNASLIVILLSGRLKSQTHVLFNKLKTYKKFNEIAFLIWEASEGGHHLRRAFVAADQLLQNRVPEKWDLQWLFAKNKKPASMNISILENVLMKENCPLKTYSLDHMSLCLLYGADLKGNPNPNFRCILNALKKNSSIVEFKFEKDHKNPGDFPREIFLQIYRKIFKTMVSMNIIHISFDTDIFIQNAELNFKLLKDLFICLNEMPKLQSLKITASTNLKNKVCNSFHDELPSNNTQASKKRSKTVTIENAQMNELVESFTKFKELGELYLSQVSFSCPQTVEKFCGLVQANALKRLSLNEMTCTDNSLISLSETLELVIKNIGPNVCHLDLQGTEFTNVDALILYVTNNTVLKTLNLANCIKDEGLIHALLLASSKSNIKKINMSSDKVEITDDTISGFCQPSQFETFIASGWKYKINEQNSLLILMKFLQQSPIKLLCLSNSVIAIHMQIHKTINETDLHGWLRNEFSKSSISLIDIQNVEIVLRLVPELSKSRNDSMDSGFHSPTRESDNEHSSFIEDDFHLPQESCLKASSNDSICIKWSVVKLKEIFSGLNFKICVNICDILESIVKP